MEDSGDDRRKTTTEQIQHQYANDYEQAPDWDTMMEDAPETDTEFQKWLADFDRENPLPASRQGSGDISSSASSSDLSPMDLMCNECLDCEGCMIPVKGKSFRA